MKTIQLLDAEEIRNIVRKEIREALIEYKNVQELPPLLNRKELMQLFHISQTKTSELLGRADFPVFREAGVLIPTKALFEWIEKNTK